MALLVAKSPFAPIFLFSHRSNGNKDLCKLFAYRRQNEFPIHVVRCSKTDDNIIGEVSRSDFPKDFLFGASSSAIQTEGTKKGDRGPSTWDNMPLADTAIDSYDKYKDDVKMLTKMSANVYRFSISWSRILPTGTLSGGISQDGLKFYNNLINELVNNGITPFVTLMHYDLPQGLQDAYNGFTSRRIVQDFADFANICFKNFGDRVKYWSTFNEPQALSQNFYGPKFPTKMPYVVTHNIILAHATAVMIYRENYQKSQQGKIGFPMMAQGFLARSDSPRDKDAAKRGYDFFLGWFLEPLVTGEYPFSMRTLVGDRLPTFTEDEKRLVKGAIDFITINYYTARYAEEGRSEDATGEDSMADDGVGYKSDYHIHERVRDLDGNLIGILTPGDTFAYIVPRGIKDVLLHLKNHYENPTIYISENGLMDPKPQSGDVPYDIAKQDTNRTKYIKDHLYYVREAMREGVNVKGYCLWCLNDSIELYAGNTVRMGFNYTDYNNDYERKQKDSAKWFGTFLNQSELQDLGNINYGNGSTAEIPATVLA